MTFSAVAVCIIQAFRYSRLEVLLIYRKEVQNTVNFGGVETLRICCISFIASEFRVLELWTSFFTLSSRLSAEAFVRLLSSLLQLAYHS